MLRLQHTVHPGPPEIQSNLLFPCPQSRKRGSIGSVSTAKKTKAPGLKSKSGSQGKANEINAPSVRSFFKIKGEDLREDQDLEAFRNEVLLTQPCSSPLPARNKRCGKTRGEETPP